MDNVNPIKIVVQDGTLNYNNATENVAPQTPQQKSNQTQPQSSSGSMTKVKAVGVASMIASQSFNYVTSNASKFTGSYQLQKNINTFQQGMNLMGMALINPYVAVASVGINLGFTALDNYNEQRYDKLDTARARARAGYDADGKVRGNRY